jgi:hypothetical protein
LPQLAQRISVRADARQDNACAQPAAATTVARAIEAKMHVDQRIDQRWR